MVKKDIHYFWIVDKDGLIPFGEIDNTSCGTYVDASDSYTTPASGKDMGCTYRLIKENKKISNGY